MSSSSGPFALLFGAPSLSQNTLSSPTGEVEAMNKPISLSRGGQGAIPHAFLG